MLLTVDAASLGCGNADVVLYESVDRRKADQSDIKSNLKCCG